MNIGLMLFRGAGDRGGRQLRALRHAHDGRTNKTNLADLIGDASCVDGTGANGTPKCIFKNLTAWRRRPRPTSTTAPRCSKTFKYFGGCTSPAFAQSGVCKTGPLGPTTSASSGIPGIPAVELGSVLRPGGVHRCHAHHYIPPAGTANSCAKNYVIVIGNGFPKDDIAGSPLSNVEGSTTQLSMPQFNTTSATMTTTIGQQCGSGGNDATQRGEPAARPAYRRA